MSTTVGRRRALAAFGATGLAALVAACGGGNDDSGGSASTSTTGTTGGTSGGVSETTAATAGQAADVAGGPLTAAAFEEAAACELTPEQMEGPYYIDVDNLRRDIREDREGSPLRLGIRVLDEACEPLPDAVVEVWHCDALGVYSGFVDASRAANGAPGGAGSPGGADGDDTRYLRGGQVANGDGIVELQTIYPGWYQGRAVHIHAKVHIGNAEVLTTQLYFDDDVSDEVFASDPYAEHAGRRTTNAEDGIYADGPRLTLSAEGDGHLGLVTMTVTR